MQIEQNTPLSFDLLTANDHMRNLILEHRNRAEIVRGTGIANSRLAHFAKNAGSTINTADLQKLLDYFGIKLTATIVAPIPRADWLPHPANPAYEYEVDGQKRPTGKVRAIAQPVAAE